MKAAHFNEDNENISPSAIKTCFKRSTLALTCKVIVEEIESDDINAPVRTWINCHLEEFFCKIRSSRVVDYDRLFACRTKILKAFYQNSSEC